MYEAKTKLSEIVEAAQAGQEIILMNRGEPVAKVIPMDGPKRRVGWCESDYWMSKDFDAPLEEFMEYMK